MDGRVEPGQGVLEGAALDWVRDVLGPVVFAPVAGSLLGVLVRRLPVGRPVGLARSACEACGRRLGWWEMVPLVGYAALGGRCRTCGAAIDPMHWWIEAAAVVPAGMAVWAGWAAGRGAGAIWADCVLGWGLLALGWIDWRHGRLPDALTLPLVLLGLGATWWLAPGGLTDHAIGAAAGYVAFRLVAWGYRAWRGREGMGQGDAKLLAAAGAWVGWQGLDAVVLLGASLSIGLALWRSRGRGLSGGVSVPFGPGLASAAFFVRLFG